MENLKEDSPEEGVTSTENKLDALVYKLTDVLVQEENLPDQPECDTVLEKNENSVRPSAELSQSNGDEIVSLDDDEDTIDNCESILGLVQDSEEIDNDGVQTRPCDDNEDTGESSRHESQSPDITVGSTVRPTCQVNLGPCDTTKCCVPNCKSNLNEQSQSTYITFPKDPSRFTEWARAINRPDLLVFMNKKESAKLLVCSKHFPKNMWINSNTRLKKLHKNAVPETDTFIEADEDNEDDDDDIVVLPPETKTPKSTRKGSGLKIRKVTSLLTDSALRDSLNSSSFTSTDISPKKPGTKWPTILQRKQALASTDMEKKLLAENNQLKSELDKNMDYILNQKSHYDVLLAKEKEKCATLSNKVAQLETETKKMQKVFEAQLIAHKSKVNNKEAGQKDLFEKLKKIQTTNSEHEKKIVELHETIASMRATNDSLTMKVNEMAESSPPPPPENLLQGENFKAFINSYLRTYKHMKNQLEELTLKVEDQETEIGQKSLLLRLAAQFLNHGQLSWLQVQLSDTPLMEEKYPDHFREFCIAFYEVSEFAYKVCRKVFGLAPIEYVEKWLKDPKSDISNINSTINALFEEYQPAIRGATLLTNVLYEKDLTDILDSNGKPLITIRKSSSSKRFSKKRKYMLDSESEYDNDGECEEGKLSDDEDELFYTSESEGESTDAPNGKSDSMDVQKGTDNLLPPPHPPVTVAGPSHSTHSDFDFMMDDTSQNQSLQMVNSMPLLVPDSPMVPVAHISGHGRKKIADTVGGNKNIFRIVNS